jgi:outer membrane autotransporter protein
VTATDEITGTFSTLDPYGLPSFVSASLGYSNTEVELNLTSEIARIPGLTGNQRAVGGALDNAFNVGGGIPDGLNAALFGLSERQVPQALGALSGEIHASERSSLINDAVYSREAVLGRLRQLTNGGAAPVASAALGGGADLPVKAAAPRPTAPGPAFWAHGLGAWSEFDGNSNASKVSSTFVGVLAGADVRVGTNWTVGLALGYSHSKTDIDNLASTAKVDTGLIAAYAGTSMGAWTLRTGGIYAFNFIDTTRSISFPGFAARATADYNAGTGQIFGEIGYNASAYGIPVEPFAGLAWVHLNTDSINESSGPAALSGTSSDSDVGYSTLGLRTAINHVMAGGTILTPRLSLAWQYAFGDLTPTAALAFAATTGANFSVTGVPIARNSALIDAGVDWRVSPNMKLGVSYFGQLSNDLNVNAVRGRFTWTF